jgi:hypothetical protein
MFKYFLEFKMAEYGSLINANAGQVPDGAKSQVTWAVMKDIAYYAPGATLTAQNLFDNSMTKTETYRNTTFNDVGQQKNVTLYGLRVTHDMQFTAISSQTKSYTQWYFENFSEIQIKILEKSYDPIPLALALPYDLNQLDATTSLNSRQVPFFTFPDPIVVPAGGNVKIKFQPATGLTAIATAATLPTLPGLSLTNDIGLSIVFQFMGLQERVIA